MAADAAPLADQRQRRVQLKLLEHHVVPRMARALAQVEFRNWSPDQLDAILRKAPVTQSHLRHFGREPRSGGGRPQDENVWVCSPPDLIERAAKEKLALCVNASGEWNLCSDNFTAISHVWIEGIQADVGNRGLSKTILDSIFTVLKPLGASWIWLDCLAIPGGNRNLTAQQEMVKKDVINNLANIYKKADAVVIFDARVMRLQSLDPIEVAVVLVCGQWITRLWTLQEICLASNGLVITATGSIQFRQMIRALCYLSGSQQQNENLLGPVDTQLLRTLKHDMNGPLFNNLYLRLARLLHHDGQIPSLAMIALSCYERQTGNDIDYARAFFPLFGLEWKVQHSREEGMNQIYSSQLQYSKRMVLMHGSPRSSFRPGWAPSYLTGLHGPILSPDDPLGDIEMVRRGLERRWFTYKISNHGPSKSPDVMLLTIRSAGADPVIAACGIDPRETQESRDGFFKAIAQGQAFLLSNKELPSSIANELAINCILVERDAEVEHTDEAWVYFTSEILAIQGTAYPEVHPWLLLHESPISTHLVSGKGHTRLARTMDYESGPKYSEAPLLLAIRKGDFAQFQTALTTDVDLQVVDLKGCTPLHLAVLYDRIPMLDELLDRSAVVDAQDGAGRTPLNLAAEEGNPQVVQKLLSHGADPNLHPFDEYGTLNQAILKRHTEIVRLLIRHNAAVDEKDNWHTYPLFRACKSFEMASILLNAGADHSTDLVGGAQLIHFAARAGQTKTVETLLDQGIDVDRREGGGADSMGPTALRRAVEEQQEGTVDLLIRRGADPNLLFEDAWTCTLLAAQSGNVNILRHMLSHRPVHFHDACLPDGKTALHLCAEKGHRIPTKMLLEAGWDHTAVDTEGRTPAALAQEQGHRSVAETIRDFHLRALKAVSQ